MQQILPAMVKIAKQLINKTDDARFALVYFAGATFAISPLTSDIDILNEKLDRVTKDSFFIESAQRKRIFIIRFKIVLVITKIEMDVWKCR